MKKLLSLMLSLALTLCALPALAEGKIDAHDRNMLRDAVGMTASMVATAMDTTFPDDQPHVFEDIPRAANGIFGK